MKWWVLPRSCFFTRGCVLWALEFATTKSSFSSEKASRFQVRAVSKSHFLPILQQREEVSKKPLKARLKHQTRTTNFDQSLKNHHPVFISKSPHIAKGFCTRLSAEKFFCIHWLGMPGLEFKLSAEATSRSQPTQAQKPRSFFLLSLGVRSRCCK